MKNSVKNKDQTEPDRSRRESNPVYLHVQATPWPLHHSDTHDLKN